MEAFLGIDASKGYADFTLLDQEKNQLEKVFQIDDTRLGHDRLRDLLARLLKRHSVNHLYCGIESTGGFENNWYRSFTEWSETMPISIARLNPAGVKKASEADLNRNITDALSSRFIAEYLIRHPESVSYEEQDIEYASYRSLHKHILLLKKQKTQLINQLKMALYFSFPELLRYVKNDIPYWVLEVLKRYPSPKKLSGLKPEKLAKINHVDVDRAKSLIVKARTSVAARENEATSFLIESLAEQLLEKQLLIAKHKKFLEQNCKGLQVNLLTKIKGIGNYSAAAIMIEIEDITRFARAKSLVCFFGVHPALKESGDKRLVVKMSKKGRGSMRGILYMCAASSVRYDEHMKAIYHRHRSKGKSHKQALGVIMQKLLRVIWGVLTSQSEYDAAIDQKNQAESQLKEQNEKNVNEIDSKRRFQDIDDDAPISRIQTKKRKVYAKSQVPELETNAGSSTHT